MKAIKKISTFLFLIISLTACNDNFLDTVPLASPSDATFWTSESNATTWINYAYRSLPSANDYQFDSMSDDCCGTGYLIAQGLLEPASSIVSLKWDYTTIRHCLELLEHLDQLPNLSNDGKNKLAGQARFILSFKYFEMITLYRDVPFFDKVLSLEESDLPKTDKSKILSYILEQLDLAINELPISWSTSENGRATKGAALALKARVLLYNSKWAEAAEVSKVIMDMNVYQLHQNYNELFLTSFNNKTKEVILAHQYAKDLYTHTLCFAYGYYSIGGTSSSLPLPDLVNSYECKDGLPISESPLYNQLTPWDNRDPRFHMNFIVPFESIGGQKYDPVNNKDDKNAAKTYVYFRKYIADMASQQRTMWVNWNIFRYAEVLLTYAEAKNEVSGPDASVYNALNQIRRRAGMPDIDEKRYNSKESLRGAIRNERRVELAGEGLRYFDILRWKIAEDVMNKEITSMVIPGLLPLRIIQTNHFDPKKHYVWPIPQSAIDNAKKLEQHAEWK
jgi:hypothetical protein